LMFQSSASYTILFPLFVFRLPVVFFPIVHNLKC
jgi:hypothetical protein